MKKIALVLILCALTIGTLVSCGSGEGDDTTTEATTTNTAATTTSEAATTTTEGTEEEPDVTTGDTNSEPSAPASSDDPAEELGNLTWVDNNDTLRYEITVNDDGSVSVSYTKEPASESMERYGYAGASWANMKADISEAYTGQSKLVMKVQGTAGQNLMIKPFDDAAYQQVLNFDGSEQEITIELNNVSDDAQMIIILFGNSGDPDVSGEFTILESGFVD
ncbi:MAG: hypothetical protein ACI3YK_07555 [Eubacteriales bacterium]